jgi:hypothetical protein
MTRMTVIDRNHSAKKMEFEAFINELKRPSNYVLTRYFKSFLSEFHKKDWSQDQLPQIVKDFVVFIVGKSLPLFENKSKVTNASTGTYLVEKNSHTFITPMENRADIQHLPNSSSLQTPVSPDSNDNMGKSVPQLIDTGTQDSMEDVLTRNWSRLTQQRLFEKLYRNTKFSVENEQLHSKCGVIRGFLKFEHISHGLKNISVSDTAIDLIVEEFSKMNTHKNSHDKLGVLVNACKILLSLIGKQSDDANDNDLIVFSDHSDTDSTPSSPVGHVTVDEYLPILIYIIMMRYPDKILYNCKFIEAFEINLTGESAYYFTNVLSALVYLQNLKPDHISGVDPGWYHVQLACHTPLPPSPPSRRRTLDKPYQDSMRTGLSVLKSSNSSNSIMNFFSKYLPNTGSSSASFHSRASSVTPPVSNREESMFESGTPNEKTSAELEEEYQIQLAIALSLSEAEQSDQK